VTVADKISGNKVMTQQRLDSKENCRTSDGRRSNTINHGKKNWTRRQGHCLMRNVMKDEQRDGE